MKNVFKLMVITAAVGLSVFFGSADVKAAEVNSLVTIDEAQVTTVSEAEFEKLDKGATASNMKALAKELKVRAILRDCFQYKPEQTYTELVANYQLHGAVGVATAKNSVAWAKEHGLLSVYLKAYKYVE